jgi:hypothetical protein
MTTIGKFFHRTNADCTIDSICSRCFMTIATGNSHDDLIGAEAAHDCTPACPAEALGQVRWKKGGERENLSADKAAGSFKGDHTAQKHFS